MHYHHSRFVNPDYQHLNTLLRGSQSQYVYQSDQWLQCLVLSQAHIQCPMCRSHVTCSNFR